MRVESKNIGDPRDKFLGTIVSTRGAHWPSVESITVGQTAHAWGSVSGWTEQKMKIRLCLTDNICRPKETIIIFNHESEPKVRQPETRDVIQHPEKGENIEGLPQLIRTVTFQYGFYQI